MKNIGTCLFRIGIIAETLSLPFIVICPKAALWLFITGAALASLGFLTAMICDK